MPPIEPATAAAGTEVRPIKRPIKLLVVDDMASDAELERRELTRAGLVVEHRLVDTAEGFQREIASFAPDVILSDYSMPNFHGFDALALARKLCPATPFIFVSGDLGEENAIRALKDGATDYILKNNLLRLPSAVIGALGAARERAARQRADTALRTSNQALEAIFEAAPVAILALDLEARVTRWNAGAERLFGWTAEEAIGRLCPLVPEVGLDAFRSQIYRAQHHGTHDVVLDCRQKASAVPLHASLSTAPMHDAAGQAIGVIVILDDMTERIAQRERIARLSRIREVSSGINAALLRVRAMQPLFEETCRIAVEVGGLQNAWVGRVDADSFEIHSLAFAGQRDSTLRSPVLSARADQASGQGIVGRSVRDRRVAVWNDIGTDPQVPQREQLQANGCASLASFPVLADDAVGFVLVLSSAEKGFFDHDELRLLGDVAGNIGFALELIARQEKVSYLANYDVLTGLANRLLFQERLRLAVETARHGNIRLGLMVFDLERFKGINDALGVQVGDELLRQIANRLLQLPLGRSCLARLGGDRFALMFPAIGDASDVIRVLGGGATSFLDAPFAVAGRELHVAAKAGIAVFPGDGVDSATLFLNAEAALTQAKLTGERALYYAPQINAHVAEQLELENRLRKAVELQEFVLHYQPKVDVRTRAIVGAEALIRWMHPEQGLVAPGLFIPMLERTGMMLPVGLWAMQEAQRAWLDWQRRGLRPPRVAVNVSAVQLREPDWVAEVERSLARASDGGHGLDLELTESLLMDDIEGAIVKLAAIRALGVAIAIDDFGTGHSSLSYIGRLPIDALKIDRSFITGMTEQPNKASLVAAIIGMARALHLKTIAEGVETEAQAQLLGELHCDQMQGFLISKAVPAGAFEAMLRRRLDVDTRGSAGQAQALVVNTTGEGRAIASPCK